MKKKVRGQSLLEFSLVAPILVLVLVVISELGYAFIVRHTIIDCIKQTVQSSHFLVGKYNTQAELLDAMQTDLQNSINAHNLPTPTSLTFGLGDSTQYGTAVIVTYSYNPSFRIIGVTPEVITVQSAQILQPGLLKINNPTVPFVATL